VGGPDTQAASVRAESVAEAYLAPIASDSCDPRAVPALAELAASVSTIQRSYCLRRGAR